MSKTFADLTGLSGAFDVQGGITDPEDLNTGRGIDLTHDVADYLARQQTYYIVEQISAVVVLNGVTATSSVLRHGRYLRNIDLITDSTGTANFRGALVMLSNTGQNPDFPAHSQQYLGGFQFAPANTNLETATVVHMVGQTGNMVLPLWCPPGSFITLMLWGAGAGPTIACNLLWASSEALKGNSPVGPARSPVKI